VRLSEAQAASQRWFAGREHLHVVPLADTIIEALGHDPCSEYVERFWLPVIGPTSLVALRRLTAYLAAAPDGYPLAVLPFSRELGLGKGIGVESPIVRTLARLVYFRHLTILGDALAVRRMIAPLSRVQADRIPPHIRAELRAWHDRERPPLRKPLRAVPD
jgi:hypothetical protein